MKLSRQLFDYIRRGASVLERDARRRIRQFALENQAVGGGFAGPGGDMEDVYYSFFGGTLLSVLGRGRAFVRLRAYAKSAPKHAKTTPVADLPHAAALAALLRMTFVRQPGLMLDRFRTADGGFSHLPGQQVQGTPYGAYLALLFAESANLPFPAEQVSQSLIKQDFNRLTQALAAGMMVNLFGKCSLGGERADFMEQGRKELLANGCSVGGFRAHPASEPDLLSTATALTALAASGGVPGSLHASMARFVEACWADNGGFREAPDFGLPDVEYTAYALLAMGALSE